MAMRTALPRRALLCAAVSVLLAVEVVAEINITEVTTAAQLQTAARDGAPHIAITKHLDLSTLEDEESDGKWYPSAVAVAPGVISITGRCEQAPADLDLAADWKPGQCVLVARDHVLFDKPDPSADLLWISDLYLLMAETCKDRDDRAAIVAYKLESFSPLYITNVTIEAQYYSVPHDRALVVAGHSVLASGLKILNFGPSESSPAVFSNKDKSDQRANSTASFIDSTFSGNNVGASNCTENNWKHCWEGAISTRYDLRLENCTFINNTASVGSPGYDVGVFGYGARVYSDDPIQFEDTGWSNESLPLAEADMATFLTLDDAAFVSWRSQVEDALATLPPTDSSAFVLQPLSDCPSQESAAEGPVSEEPTSAINSRTSSPDSSMAPALAGPGAGIVAALAFAASVCVQWLWPS